MNRLNQLLKAHTSGTINESDYPEFIESLVNVLNEQGEMLTYYREQLQFLLNDTVKTNKTRKVN